MSALVKTELLDKGVRDFLADKTGKPWGLIDEPLEFADADASYPYGIVYPLGSSAGKGSWAQVEEDKDFLYQLTFVSIEHKSMAWLRDRAQNFMVEIAAGGGYRYPIPLPEGSVQWRTVDSLGVPSNPGGEGLYQVQDSYRLRVGASS